MLEVLSLDDDSPLFVSSNPLCFRVVQEDHVGENSSENSRLPV